MKQEKVISLALSCVGYLEKATNRNLDDPKANAGSGNFTKFARDLDAVPNFYNGKKNGFPWCDVFVDWLFVTAFGAENARKLLCQPEKSLGAGCGYSARYYREKGRFFTRDPQRGDQIFFLDGSGAIAHTGIVYKTDGEYVYTVEGNTALQGGVVSNGGGVWCKQYRLDCDRIYGYGRPCYENINQPETAKKGEYSMQMRVLKKGCKGEDVRALQILLTGNGCTCGVWGADGNFGAATEAAVGNYQKKNKLQVDGMAGPETMKSLLGAA